MPKAQEAEFLTIAAIRKPKGRRETQYLFNEKQQIFTFRSKTKRSRPWPTSSSRSGG